MDQSEFDILEKKLEKTRKLITEALDESDNKVFRVDNNGVLKEPENSAVLEKYKKALFSSQEKLQIIREKIRANSLTFNDALSEYSKIEYFIEALIENAEIKDLKRLHANKNLKKDYRPIISISIPVFLIFGIFCFYGISHFIEAKKTKDKMEVILNNLQEIHSRISAGINSGTYSDKVSDLKVEFDVFSLSERAKKHAAYKHLEKAVEVHVRSSRFWSCSIRESESWSSLGVVKKHKCEFPLLAIAYDLETNEEIEYFFYEETVREFWVIAEKSLDLAKESTLKNDFLIF